MPKPVKVVVYFDDGTQIERSLDGITSVYVNENAAREAGRNPPYKNGHDKKAAASTTDPAPVMSLQGGQCYYVNGMIFCP